MEIKLNSFNRNEVLQYLLWRGGEIEQHVDQMIDECMAQTLDTVRPRWIWRVLELDRVAELPAIAFAGADVRKLLHDCEKVIFFAATLGTEFEALVRRAQARNLTQALVLDACGSAAIEAVCEEAVNELQKNYPEFVYLTDRFSPGYGDLKLDFQQELLNLIDAGRAIGLTATDSQILVPRKSVTALIGVADQPQQKRFRGCAYCSMFANCMYRKAGKTCGRE